MFNELMGEWCGMKKPKEYLGGGNNHSNKNSQIHWALTMP